MISNTFNAKSVYDVYGVSVDNRSLYGLSKDKTIVTKIQAYLLQKGTKVLTIDVESIYGHVYLIGDYSSKEEVDELVKYTQTVSGVRKIHLYLLNSKDIKNCSIAKNLSLLTNVKYLMLRDQYITGPNVHVHAAGCHIVLVGIVKNDVMAIRAVKTAKSVDGVVLVKSFLRAIN